MGPRPLREILDPPLPECGYSINLLKYYCVLRYDLVNNDEYLQLIRIVGF